MINAGYLGGYGGSGHGGFGGGGHGVSSQTVIRQHIPSHGGFSGIDEHSHDVHVSIKILTKFKIFMNIIFTYKLIIFYPYLRPILSINTNILCQIMWQLIKKVIGKIEMVEKLKDNILCCNLMEKLGLSLIVLMNTMGQYFDYNIIYLLNSFW